MYSVHKLPDPNNGKPYTIREIDPCHVLTLADLDTMEPHTIFKVFNPPYALSEGALCFVAKRGQINDWAVYVSASMTDPQSIARYGKKLYSEKDIRDLVPCDDDAFSRYRL